MSEKVFKPKISVVQPGENNNFNLENYKGKLRAMIVVPSLREGIGIVDTILNACKQIKDPNNYFRHGITIVLNKKTNAGEKEEESKRLNIETLKLLVFIKTGVNLFSKRSKKIDREIEKKVYQIRESKIPIFLIDASSDGHTHDNMNVGMARGIGTDFALDQILEEDDNAFIVSTDADTTLSEEVLKIIHDSVSAGEAYAGPIEWTESDEGLSDREKRTNLSRQAETNLVSACKNIFRAISTLNGDFSKVWINVPVKNQKILQDLIDMPGAGSFLTRRAMKIAGGYKSQGFHEDTDLIFNIAKLGIVKRLGKTNPKFYFKTKSRISDRPENGFGHQMSKFSFEKGKMRDLLVNDLNSEIVEDMIFMLIDKCLRFFPDFNQEDERVRHFQAELKIMESSELIQEGDISELVDLFVKMGTEKNNFGHHRLIKAVKNIAERNFPKISIDMFQEKLISFFERIIEQVRGGEAIRFIPKSAQKIFDISYFVSILNEREFLRTLGNLLDTQERTDIAFLLETMISEWYVYLGISHAAQGAYYQMTRNFILEIGELDRLEAVDNFYENVVDKILEKSILERIARLRIKMLYRILENADLSEKEKNKHRKMLVYYGSLVADSNKELREIRKEMEPKILEHIERNKDFFKEAGISKFLWLIVN